MTKSAILDGNTVVNIIVGTIEDSVACPDHVGIGWTYAAGTFTAPSVPPPSLAEMHDRINAERERRIAAGATVTVTGAGAIPVQGRDVDIRNLQGLGLMALARVSTGDSMTVTTFRDALNVDHDLTPPQVLELVQRASAAAEAIIQASWAIKAMDPLPDDVTDDGLWPSS